MFTTMVANSWTTVIGVCLGVVSYVAQSGATMPTSRKDWLNLLVGALLAGLGVVAKDATTGSKPGA